MRLQTSALRPQAAARKTSGESIEDTQWHRVTFYERLAEIAGEYLKKGKPVYVEGRLKYGTYTDKAGVEKATCDIVATELQLLGGREDQQAKPAAPAQQRQPTPDKSSNQSSGFDDMDSDIPF